MTLTATHARQTLHHEAIDWASRVVSNGGTASIRTIRAVSRFCSEVQAAGIRDRFHRLNLFCGTGLTAVMVPLYRGPSFGGTTFGGSTDSNVNFVSGDYTETSGLTGNASTKYLNTGVPINTLSASSTHFGVGLLATDVGIAYKGLIGCFRAGSYDLSLWGARSDGSPTASFGLAGTAKAGDIVNTTPLAVGRIVASYPSMFRNGSTSGSTASTSTNATNADSIYVFALNNAGSVGSYSAARIGFYSYGSTMTSTQVTAFNAALTRFYTALGRS
jgi:hypothetical protein